MRIGHTIATAIRYNHQSSPSASIIAIVVVRILDVICMSFALFFPIAVLVVKLAWRAQGCPRYYLWVGPMTIRRRSTPPSSVKHAASVMKRAFMPVKKRCKRRVNQDIARSGNLALARRARAAARARRKRLEAAGILYTPKYQKTETVRRGRASLSKQYTLDKFLSMTTKMSYKCLLKLGYFRAPRTSCCSGCGRTLAKKVYFSRGRHPFQRCQRGGCRVAKTRVTAGTWADHEIPLPKLAALAFLACGSLSSRPTQDDAAIMTGVSHKVCAAVSKDLLSIVHTHQKLEQAKIKLEGQCEADATTVRTVRLRNGRLLHVRFFGMSKRGDHKKTVVYPLPVYTTPAGGKTRPESIAETEHLMQRHTGKGSLIWHTDGARCYRHFKNNTRVKHAKKLDGGQEVKDEERRHVVLLWRYPTPRWPLDPSQAPHPDQHEYPGRSESTPARDVGWFLGMAL